MSTIENVWTILTVLTLLTMTISWAWIAVRAFQRHWIWGLAVIGVPLAPLAFAVVHWDRVRRPFLIGFVAGLVLFVELLITRGYQALFG